MFENNKELPPLHLMSFGAGVQSTTMLHLVLNKDERMWKVMGAWPKAIIFADPQREVAATYAHVEKMKAVCDKAGLPFFVTTKGDLGAAFLHSESRAATIPVFADKGGGKVGMLRRNCTRDYKIDAITKQIRDLLGVQPRKWVKRKIHTWIGISTDEIERMKDSGRSWEIRVHPLIKMNWSRQHCYQYLKEIGEEVPPKSACYMCPYHSDDFWRELKEIYPDEFAKACQFDEGIRDHYKTRRFGIEHPLYLHRSCVPLRDIDWSTSADVSQLNLFDMLGECDGMCGV